MTRIIATSPAVYPATDAQIRAHVSAMLGGNRSIGPNALAGDLTAYDVHEVAEGTQPTPAANERVVEGAPALVEGVWTRQWSVVELDEAEQAAKLENARRRIREIAAEKTPELSAAQTQAIAERMVAALDPSPTAQKYPLVGAIMTATGGNLASALDVIDGWRAGIATVMQAQGEALKELDDNGLAGIPAAIAIMDAI